ncbi:PPOX class F420-dependent oxidoreductase [Microbacterium excoecariae]|uniref:PPOX class F420-dependent oxidoreductase n=1 Tax=Microbacterium excoecariae TaxID=2715210 RepID=UPI0014086C9E|nr:PPOX class F420-dependent oxidoreductase [Microbacterium excoecariae]NHI17019.1 PPOX class F420-dependent oxidoreductase [Microbacterium excoecariae]
MRTLTDAGVSFVRERHLATLSTLAPWGGIHVVPVGFTFHDGIVRIITSGGSQKVKNVLRDGTATVSQVDGARWLTFPGRASVSVDPDEVTRAVALYAERYRTPRENPTRVVIRIEPTRLLGGRGLVD